MRTGRRQASDLGRPAHHWSMTQTRSRRPAGSPSSSGGQFTTDRLPSADLDLQEPSGSASTTSTEPDLPDFATCSQLSTDRWEAVAKATREADETTTGSLAGLVADRYPDASRCTSTRLVRRG